MEWFVLAAIAFGGYAVGRVGHIYGGHLNTPHHWIYGVLAVIVGAILYSHSWGIWLIAFGVGHTISDFKDMLALKFYGPDEPGRKRFWGID